MRVCRIRSVDRCISRLWLAASLTEPVLAEQALEGSAEPVWALAAGVARQYVARQRAAPPAQHPGGGWGADSDEALEAPTRPQHWRLFASRPLLPDAVRKSLVHSNRRR